MSNKCMKSHNPTLRHTKCFWIKYFNQSGQFGKFCSVHELWTIYSTGNSPDMYNIRSYQGDVRTLGMVLGQIIVKKWSKRQKVALIQDYHILSKA